MGAWQPAQRQVKACGGGTAVRITCSRSSADTPLLALAASAELAAAADLDTNMCSSAARGSSGLAPAVLGTLPRSRGTCSCLHGGGGGHVHPTLAQQFVSASPTRRRCAYCCIDAAAEAQADETTPSLRGKVSWVTPRVHLGSVAHWPRQLCLQSCKPV